MFSIETVDECRCHKSSIRIHQDSVCERGKTVKHSKTRLKIFKTCAAICDGVVHSWHFAFQSSEDGASPKWFHEDSSVHCDGCAH